MGVLCRFSCTDFLNRFHEDNKFGIVCKNALHNKLSRKFMSAMKTETEEKRLNWTETEDVSQEVQRTSK